MCGYPVGVRVRVWIKVRESVADKASAREVRKREREREKLR